MSPLADWVNYPGASAALANPSYPHPTSGFIRPSSSPALRNFANWYVGGIDSPPTNEYETMPRFCTTLQGGVFVAGFQPLRSAGFEDSYERVIHNLPINGGRNDNMTDPYSNFVSAPDDSGRTPRGLETEWDGAYERPRTDEWATRCYRAEATAQVGSNVRLAAGVSVWCSPVATLAISIHAAGAFSAP